MHLRCHYHSPTPFFSPIAWAVVRLLGWAPWLEDFQTCSSPSWALPTAHNPAFLSFQPAGVWRRQTFRNRCRNSNFERWGFGRGRDARRCSRETSIWSCASCCDDCAIGDRLRPRDSDPLLEEETGRRNLTTSAAWNLFYERPVWGSLVQRAPSSDGGRRLARNRGWFSSRQEGSGRFPSFLLSYGSQKPVQMRSPLPALS